MTAIRYAGFPGAFSQLRALGARPHSSEPPVFSRTTSEPSANHQHTRERPGNRSSRCHLIYILFIFTYTLLTTLDCIQRFVRNGQTNELNINKMFGLGNMWEMRPLFYNLLNRAHGRMLLKK